MTDWICTDCMFVLANGETEGEPDCEPLGLLENMDISLGMLWEDHSCGKETDESLRHDDCECETVSFSMSSCPACGTCLGGSRHAAVIKERTK